MAYIVSHAIGESGVMPPRKIESFHLVRSILRCTEFKNLRLQPTYIRRLHTKV